MQKQPNNLYEPMTTKLLLQLYFSQKKKKKLNYTRKKISFIYPIACCLHMGHY
ncbi:unnamed protein product, partial [Musa acuminata subsp. burmannicoides]